MSEFNGIFQDAAPFSIDQGHASGLAAYVAIAATMNNDPLPCTLRSIGPLSDPDVWVVLDDGCNSTSHGRVSMGSAAGKLRDRRYVAKLVRRSAKEAPRHGASRRFRTRSGSRSQA